MTRSRHLRNLQSRCEIIGQHYNESDAGSTATTTLKA